MFKGHSRIKQWNTFQPTRIADSEAIHLFKHDPSEMNFNNLRSTGRQDFLIMCHCDAITSHTICHKVSMHCCIESPPAFWGDICWTKVTSSGGCPGGDRKWCQFNDKSRPTEWIPAKKKNILKISTSCHLASTVECYKFSGRCNQYPISWTWNAFEIATNWKSGTSHLWYLHPFDRSKLKLNLFCGL